MLAVVAEVDTQVQQVLEELVVEEQVEQVQQMQDKLLELLI